MKPVRISDHHAIVFFTGAGMSAESGVPTYRGSGGIWHQYRWEEYASQEAFDQNAEKVLKFHEMRQKSVLQCQPHPGHYLLARIEQEHPRITIVTQNIDGMHQRAGSRNVVELHGSLWRMRCTEHGIFEDMGETFKTKKCSGCGAWLRPDIVWFGDYLSPDVTDEATRAIKDCDLFISIGTSGVVYPAASFPKIAMNRGARCIEINPEPNEASYLYLETIREPAGKGLMRLFEDMLLIFLKSEKITTTVRSRSLILNPVISNIMTIENNNNRFFNLSDITNRVQVILQPHMGKLFWVKAEIASGRERGGSFYCDLVETDGNGKIIAQIRCTIWNRDLDTIKRVFREHDLELKLENGTVFGFQCSLQYSPQYSLSLKAVAADPTFALGELELRKKQIIDRLNKEGLFEINKRLSVPLLPQRIGLVASKDSAGYNDILKTFQTSSFGFKIYLADAIVQGNQAERCVLKALDALEKLQVDLVIIARGGGSKTDLSALDNESIARRIASYTIPVWTGIGHEIDTSVLDFVANRYFKTPTAVAEEIVARYIEMQRHLEEAETRFRSTWSYRLEIEKTYIYDVKVGIVQGTRKLLETNFNDLRGSAATLSSKVQERISVEKSRVAVFKRTLITSPISVITIAGERCLDKRRRFTSNCNKAISDRHREISLMMNRFQMSRFLQIISQAQQCLHDWNAVISPDSIL